MGADAMADRGPRRVRVRGDLFHGRVPAGAVYVGRAAPGLRRSPYANPFRPTELTAAARADAARRFRDWICARPELLAAARAELAGKDLACWCPPGPCHGEELLRLCTITVDAGGQRHDPPPRNARNRIVSSPLVTGGETDPSDDEVLPVELAGTTTLVARSSVRYVEAQGDYTRLHTHDGKSHLVRIPLCVLQERWREAGFVRIHRSYLMSLSEFTELRSSGVECVVRLGSGPMTVELPVSRRHTRELKDRLALATKQAHTQQ